nr:MAG TPA: hypothetical protein [Caudoviricetes sp.]
MFYVFRSWRIFVVKRVSAFIRQRFLRQGF